MRDYMTKTDLYDEICSQINKVARNGDRAVQNEVSDAIMAVVNRHVYEMQEYTADDIYNSMIYIKRNMTGYVKFSRLKMLLKHAVKKFAIPER